MLKKILLAIVLMVSGTCCASEYKRVYDFNQQDHDYITNLKRQLWSLDIPKHQEDRLYVRFTKDEDGGLSVLTSIARHDRTNRRYVVNEFSWANDDARKICKRVSQFVIDNPSMFVENCMARLAIGDSNYIFLGRISYE